MPLRDHTNSSDLTHDNGTCNRSHRRDCWERWIADTGTCAKCREELETDQWDVTFQARDEYFLENDRYPNKNYRLRHNPQDLAGQETPEYQVTRVLSKNYKRLRRSKALFEIPSPFSEGDIMRLWFSRHRSELINTGLSDWQALLQSAGPHSSEVQLMIVQIQDVRIAFNRLASILPRISFIHS